MSGMNKWIAIPALIGAVVLGGAAMVANADHRQMNMPIEKDNYTNTEVASASFQDKEIKTEVETNDEIPAYEMEAEARPDAMIYEGLAEAKEEISLSVLKGAETEKAEKQEKVKKDKKSKKSEHYESIMSAEEAIAIAKKSVQGTVREVELDEDDGRYTYEIEIHDGVYEYELEIDAMTGEIVDFEKDLD